MRDLINQHWKKLLVRARCISRSTFDRGSKENRLDLSTNQENYDQAYPSSFTLAQNENMLLLADSYLFRQGMPLGMSLICVFFVLLMPFVVCISALLLGAEILDVSLGFLGLMPMAAAVASMAYIPSKYELDRMPISPVVFNRKTGEVYFFGEISGEAF